MTLLNESVTTASTEIFLLELNVLELAKRAKD